MDEREARDKYLAQYYPDWINSWRNTKNKKPIETNQNTTPVSPETQARRDAARAKLEAARKPTIGVGEMLASVRTRVAIQPIPVEKVERVEYQANPGTYDGQTIEDLNQAFPGATLKDVAPRGIKITTSPDGSTLIIR